jgi:hypothetical protein
MVERIYKYFDLDLSESHSAKFCICTLLDPRFKKFNMWPTLHVENSQLYTQSTTLAGTSNSYVKCGPRISKLLRVKKTDVYSNILSIHNKICGTHMSVKLTMS